MGQNSTANLRRFIREILDRYTRQSAGMIGGADMGGPIHMGKPAWQLGTGPEDVPDGDPVYEEVPDFLLKRDVPFVLRHKASYDTGKHGKKQKRKPR